VASSSALTGRDTLNSSIVTLPPNDWRVCVYVSLRSDASHFCGHVCYHSVETFSLQTAPAKTAS
jgi:hypothetical protein